jgi:hypothetical protein
MWHFQVSRDAVWSEKRSWNFLKDNGRSHKTTSLLNVYAYLDDIVVGLKTRDEYGETLEKLFKRLVQMNSMVQKKRVFFTKMKWNS